MVHHRLFDYRGVVVDIDRTFALSEEWYHQVAKSRGTPIAHPLLAEFFDAFENGHYVRRRSLN